jgi:hypothetical protein
LLDAQDSFDAGGTQCNRLFEHTLPPYESLCQTPHGMSSVKAATHKLCTNKTWKSTNIAKIRVYPVIFATLLPENLLIAHNQAVRGFLWFAKPDVHR